MKVDGYVFDFGGVISVSPMPKWDRTYFPYCRSIGLDPEIVLEGFKRYRRLWDGDFITFAEMYGKIFADAGLPPPSTEQLATIERLDKRSWVDELRDDTLELMRKLKGAGYRLGILSNMSSDFHRDCFAPRCARYRELADVEVISGFERLYKPDPAIYAVTAERMGIEPAKLMFYDDFIENVEGARACGWQSTLYPASIVSEEWMP